MNSAATNRQHGAGSGLLANRSAGRLMSILHEHVVDIQESYTVGEFRMVGITGKHRAAGRVDLGNHMRGNALGVATSVTSQLTRPNASWLAPNTTSTPHKANNQPCAPLARA